MLMKHPSASCSLHLRVWSPNCPELFTFKFETIDNGVEGRLVIENMIVMFFQDCPSTDGEKIVHYAFAFSHQSSELELWFFFSRA